MNQDRKGDGVEFGPFRLHPEQRLLTHHGIPVPLGDRAFDILRVLVEHAPNVVSGRTLLDEVWAGVFVQDVNIRLQIATLRKALGEGKDGARYISTVANRGYCFVAPLSRSPSGAIAAASPDGTTDAGDEADSATAPSPETNLPVPLADIIGRDREIAEMQERVMRSRLVTLVGPGGVGKTRLAVDLGWRLLNAFPAGVWLIDLAPVSDPGMVASAAAAALRVSVEKADATVDTIVASVGKAPRLLIFDNCEHLIAAAAALVRTLLERAPGLSVLATSRQDLHLAAEQVYGLDPLKVPPAGAVEMSKFGAAELFIARARAADRLFELNEGNSAAVGEICRHLDGLPLALEMAAPRLRMLGIDGLRRGLDDRLRMLKGAPNGDARHASLRAVLELSHSLLAPLEQRVFRRLAVFPGSFSLEAAIEVGGEKGDESWDVVDALGRLIDRSMVTLEQREPPRYRLLETLRLYAAEQLQTSGEAEGVAERHARHFQSVFNEAELCWEETPDPDWLARYQPELDNLRAALEWAHAEPLRRGLAIALAASGALLLTDMSMTAEARKCVDRAIPLIDDATPIASSARLLMRAAVLYARTLDPEGLAFAERTAALYRELGDRPNLAVALGHIGYYGATQSRHKEVRPLLLEAQQLIGDDSSKKSRCMLVNLLGIISIYIGDATEARLQFMEALDLARALKSAREPTFLANLGVTEYLLGDLDRAIELTRDALSHGRTWPGRVWQGNALCNLGAYLIARGRPLEARPPLAEALSALTERGNFPALSCLQPWAVLGAVEGRLLEAAQLVGFIDAERARLGQAPAPSEQPLRDRLMGLLEAGLQPAELETCRAEGARWSEAEAIEFATAHLLPAFAPSALRLGEPADAKPSRRSSESEGGSSESEGGLT
ncbi:MAG TPA: winged helix-turn-helix domain-containing protein [Caulobacteraceae bacterium]